MPKMARWRLQERLNPTGASKDPSIFAALTEKAFQAMVITGLRQRGWLVFVVPDMRMTTAGLPDIVAIRPGRVLLWELKTEKGRVRPEQQVVIDALPPGSTVDARIVRPSQWAEVEEVLK
jgi:hypothetical protein